MSKEWYELKTILQELMDNSCKGMDLYIHRMVYSLIIVQMNHIESESACKSLKEAGY